MLNPADEIKDPNELELVRSLSKDSFFDFMREFWPVIIAEKPVWNWHIEKLCDEAQEVMERVFAGEPKKYDLVVNVPPGSTKSTVFSVMLDAWGKARMPSLRFLSACYAFNLAQDLSRKTREIIKSPKYRQCFPNSCIGEDQDAKGHFVLTGKGERYAVGAGGVVVGKHFHVISVDDPIDPQSAYSQVEVDDINRWFDETLSQRVVDRQLTPFIIVMQRLGVEDLSGFRLSKTDPVKHICLPSEDRWQIKPGYFKRYYKKNGGLLDPVRLPREVLAKEEKKGKYFYAGQHGQSPLPLGGGMFQVQKLIITRIAPEYFRFIVRYWDKAATSAGGAFSVGVKMGIDKLGRIWVLNVKRGQWNTSQRERIIDLTAREDTSLVTVGLEQEPGSGGKDSAETTRLRLAKMGVRVRVEKPTGDKVLRADTFSGEVNGGNVYLLEAGWNKDYIDELRFFPNSKYMDQVDSSSGAYRLLTKRAGTYGIS